MFVRNNLKEVSLMFDLPNANCKSVYIQNKMYCVQRRSLYYALYNMSAEKIDNHELKSLQTFT